MITSRKLILIPPISGYTPLSEGACGGNDAYGGNSLDSCGLPDLQKCMEKCIEKAECTAITFRESDGSCGIHEGAISIRNSGGWTTGYSCYEKPSKFPDILFVILFVLYKLLRNGLITHLLN